LWIFEGFTSYYDDLILLRSGVISQKSYLDLLKAQIDRYLQNPGRFIQSVSESSFDAWIKFYRQDENSNNAGTSYYNKGSLVALCLDLGLRLRGSNLDALCVVCMKILKMAYKLMIARFLSYVMN
jgi:predicted metalloprotease with PDZ domain